MEPAKVIKKQREIADLISNKRLRQGMEQLKSLAEAAGNAELMNKLENTGNTYKYMVKYTIEGIKDPERSKVYLHLIQTLFELNDQIRETLLAKYSGWHTYWLKENMQNEQKLAGKRNIASLDDIRFKEELDQLLKEKSGSSIDPESDLSLRHKRLITDIFNHLWLTDNYDEAEFQLAELAFNKDKFQWFERSIFISAVTLSALRIWDEGKIRILAEQYRNGDNQVMERAIAGLLLVLFKFDQRISYYPEVVKLLETLADDEDFINNLRVVILQTVRSRETERISKKLHDEILPQVAKLRPKIEEKLDLDKILPEDILEDKNPDWQDMFKESEDLFKTMEEFSKLQMEGADVYMSAFANLKNFDFFRTLPNWFVPFYPDHDIVDVLYRDETLSSGTNELAEALYKTPFICNSDKFSLVLNLQHLPVSQKEMMLKVFRMELEGLEQMKDSELGEDPFRNFKSNVTQYLQDLYRFYKLSPYRKEFDDIFSGPLSFYKSNFFTIVFKDGVGISAFADYYFGKDYYEEALDLYLELIQDSSEDPQLYEKAGYCYQKTGDYKKAAEMYRNADILDKKTWTLKKLGFCNRRLGINEEALKYYLEAESIDPDNMHTIAMIGQCYLDLEDYESALKYYFRVEYNDPDNTNVLRPIAWCYFVQGNLEQSQKYYNKLPAGRLSAHDYINTGHLALCLGEKARAIDSYRKSIVEGSIDKTAFLDIFEDDSDILKRNGIDPDDLPIITDYLFFDLED